MADHQTLQLKGETYELVPWNVEDGNFWLFHMLTLAGPVAGMGKDVPLGIVLGGLNRDTMIALWATCRRFTYRVWREKGDDLRLSLDKLETRAVDPFRTPYIDLMTILKAHVNREYEDFFLQLPALLGAGKDSSDLKSPPG